MLNLDDPVAVAVRPVAEAALTHHGLSMVPDSFRIHQDASTGRSVLMPPVSAPRETCDRLTVEMVNRLLCEPRLNLLLGFSLRKSQDASPCADLLLPIAFL